MKFQKSGTFNSSVRVLLFQGSPKGKIDESEPEFFSPLLRNAMFFLSLPDIDECAPNSNALQLNCGQTGDCLNTVGSYVCFCKKGFVKDGSSCVGTLM